MPVLLAALAFATIAGSPAAAFAQPRTAAPPARQAVAPDAGAAPAGTVCEGLPVRVAAPPAGDPRDVADVCEGARHALAFFGGLGLQAIDGLAIEIAAQLPAAAGPTAAGCFVEARKRIYLVPFRTFIRHKTWFGIPITRDIYRSLATHESAHALAGCHFAVADPTIQAKEYIAYVATFSMMPPAVRERALRALPGSGFDSEARITPLLYLFDPMRFGAESYRHFRKEGNGEAFVRKILAGGALRD